MSAYSTIDITREDALAAAHAAVERLDDEALQSVLFDLNERTGVVGVLFNFQIVGAYTAETNAERFSEYPAHKWDSSPMRF